MSGSKSNVSRGRSASAAWIARLRTEAVRGPKAQAIADGLANAIARGELAAGDRLPAQRRLAHDLDVDLTTVTRAFAQAEAMGLIGGEAGRGTFVRGPGSPRGPIVDLSMNLPPPPADLSLRDLLRHGIADVLRSGDPGVLTSYRRNMGSRRDRLAGAAWLSPRLGEIAADRVFVAPGAQSALTALLAMLARHGDTVLAEPLTYPGTIAAARLLNVRLQPLVCDDDGPTPASIEAACKKGGVRALYITPTLQNPTTRTIPMARRTAIVAAARRHDLMVIEDDAYGAFLPKLSPLVRLAPERVIHVATLSKCLSPGLRTAYVIAPEGGVSARVADALRAACLMPAPILSDLATRWIERGDASTLFAGIDTESRARMKLARAILPSRAQCGTAGFHMWLTAPRHWGIEAYVAAAQARGVVTVAADAFSVAGDHPAAIRISLGAAKDRGELTQALRALVQLEREER